MVNRNRGNLRVNTGVLGSMSRLEKSGKEFFAYSRIKTINESRVYGIDYVLSQNEQMHRNGQVIDLKPEETYRIFESIPNRKGNYQKAIDSLKQALKKVKRNDLKIPTSESHIEMVQDGDADLHSYCYWLEETVIKLEEYQGSVSESVEIISETSNEKFDALKAKAKELGISTKGKQTVESLTKKIEAVENETINE